MHHYIVGGWCSSPKSIFSGHYNDLQSVGGYIVLGIGIFTELNFLATPPQNDSMKDLNGIKTFLFESKNVPKSLTAGAPSPDPTRKVHRVLNTVGEDGHE